MSLTISGTNSLGALSSLIEPFRIRPRDASDAAAGTGSGVTGGDVDTVTTSSRAPLTDTDAASLMSGLHDTMSNQRADALSAHAGLDYTRAMKLLEGLE